MLEMINLVLALMGTLAIGWHDFKTSDIPEMLVFPLLVLGLLVAGVDSYITSNIAYITNSVLTLLLFGIFGGILYYGRAWGDGDWALLAAVGANITFYSIGTATIFPFAASYMINLFFFGMFYSVLYVWAYLRKNPQAIKEFWHIFKKRELTFIATVALALSLYWKFSLPFVLMTSVVLALSVPFYSISKIGEKFMERKISARDLREGDVLSDGRIQGLTKAEIDRLKRSKKFVKVKDGVRYGLVFFFALVLTLAGDVTGLLLIS